jgi:hypothetical protein
MFEVTARLKIREGELLSKDGTECEVREGYADPDGLLEHAQHVFEALEEA